MYIYARPATQATPSIDTDEDEDTIPEVMEEEIAHAIQKLKSNKAPASMLYELSKHSYRASFS